MRDSSFAFVGQQGIGADPRLAMGHAEGGTPMAAVPMSLKPAAQFTTTAADMGLLARFLMGDGRIDGQPFIDPRLLRAMGHSHALLVTPVGTRTITTGLQTDQPVSLFKRAPLWASLVAGLLGIAWLLLAGTVRVLARRRRALPAWVPLLGIASLLLPLPLFYAQSFLGLGDLTAASGLLALATLLCHWACWPGGCSAPGGTALRS